MDSKNLLSNPSENYAKPEDILHDESLTKKQKIELLRRWEYDARELEVAEEENMAGGPLSQLSDVLKALHSLDTRNHTEHAPPTKQGGR